MVLAVFRAMLSSTRIPRMAFRNVRQTFQHFKNIFFSLSNTFEQHFSQRGTGNLKNVREMSCFILTKCFKFCYQHIKNHDGKVSVGNKQFSTLSYDLLQLISSNGLLTIIQIHSW